MSVALLKILLTVHQFFPRHIHGTERYTLDLAKALKSLGHDVVVLTRNHHQEDSRDRDWNEYVFDGIRVLAIDLVTHARTGFESSFEREDLDAVYADILCEERPDIIHCCHLLYLGSNFVSVAAQTRVPVFMSFTDFFGICWTNRLQKFHSGACRGPDEDALNCIQDVLRTVEKPFGYWLMNIAYRVVVRSEWGVRFLRVSADRGWLRSTAVLEPIRGIEKRRGCITSHYRQATQYIAATSYLRNSYIRAGYPEEKVTLMHFGIEQPTPSEVAELRQRYITLSTSARPMVIGFIGQIAKHKGLLDLMEAFKQAAIANTALHLFGDMKQDPKFSRIIEEIVERQPGIKLLGTFPGGQVYQKLAGIDVLVIPSTWAENSPLILLNALASRTMVVVTNVEGMADLIIEGTNGRLVPVNAPGALAAVLTSLAERRKQLIEWHDGPFQSYSTSPLDYARKVAELYRQKRQEAATPARFRREDFPRRQIKPVTVSCERMSAQASPTDPAGCALIVQNMSLECRDESRTLRATLPGASTFFEFDAWAVREITIVVKWPRDGLAVVYFATDREPDFNEARKIVKIVPGNVWCRFSIGFQSDGERISRLRWDPLYDGVGLPVEIRMSAPIRGASEFLADVQPGATGGHG